MSTRNITKIFRLATPDEREQGMSWYAGAYAFAASLDSDVERAAGIIAALSPLQQWTVNMSMAAEFYDGRRNCGLPDNVAKCERILAGERPEDVLGGKKVRAFYFNIVGSGSDEAVTIDRHAIAVCEGRVIPDNELKAYFGVKRNRQYVAEYKAAAKILSKEYGPLTAAQVQAIVWVYWRKHRAKNKIK